MKKETYIKLGTLLLLVILAYLPTGIWMVQRWSEKDTYYSHGYLVPFICLFLVWLKKETLLALPLRPSASGWILFASGIALHAVSAMLRVYFTSGFSLIPVIAGLILLFAGPQHLLQLWFALAFMVFMIPLPLVAIASLSFRLKILAAHISTLVINQLGVPALREGSIIKTRHAYVVVEDPCSGIRSLIALIALGALMAYFSHLSRTKKIILCAASIPIAVSSNILRIVTLSLASEMYGAQLAAGAFHTAMGILVFVFAFIGLWFLAKLLE